MYSFWRRPFTRFLKSIITTPFKFALLSAFTLSLTPIITFSSQPPSPAPHSDQELAYPHIPNFSDNFGEGDIVVVLIEPSNYQPALSEMIIKQIQKIPNKQRVKLYKVQTKEDYQLLRKYNSSLSPDQFMLIKARYINKFIPFTLHNFLQKKQLINESASKLIKLNSKTWKDFVSGISLISKTQSVVLMYNPKGSADYQAFKSKFKKITIFQYLQGSKFLYVMINDPAVLAQLNLSPESIQSGHVMILNKHTSSIIHSPNLAIQGTSFYLHRNAKLFDKQFNLVLNENLNQFSLQPLKRSIQGRTRFVVQIKIDLNKISQEKRHNLLKKARSLKRQLLSNSRNDIEVIIIHDHLQNNPYQIIVQDELGLQRCIQLASNTAISLLNQQLSQQALAKGQSFRYDYSQQMQLRVLDQFLSKLSQKPRHHPSQNFSFNKFSRKLTAQTFKQMPQGTVVFILNDKSQKGILEFKAFQTMAEQHKQYCRLSGERNQLNGINYRPNQNTVVTIGKQGFQTMLADEFIKESVKLS